MVDTVGGVGPLGGAPGSSRIRPVEPKETRAADSVEVSGDVQRLSQIPGIRLDKVLAIRKAIADGTYDTPEKLNIALDSAIDEAFREKS